MCPKCKKRPRRVSTTGLVGSYCTTCDIESQRERKGQQAAERDCTRCGRTYRGNSRAAAQVCPECRSVCAACGKAKTPGDVRHTLCGKCRASDKKCVDCGNPPMGNRTQCWSCLSADGLYAAQVRDRLYNLAPGWYDKTFAEQRGLCDICGQPERAVSKTTGKVYPLAVDHDRSCCPGNSSCGKCIRRLICRNHNVGLGMFGDDPKLLRAAADYIVRFART